MAVSEDSVLQLTDSEKVMVIGICLGLLSLTIIVTVCVVSPYCWLHTCLYKEDKLDKRKRQKYENYGTPEETTRFKLTVGPQHSLQAGRTLKWTPEFVHNERNRKYTNDSTYSSMSSGSKDDATLSSYSEKTLNGSSANGGGNVNHGHIIFGVKYEAHDSQNNGQLLLLIKKVQQLLSRPYGGSCDPYVQIKVLKEKSRKRRSKRQQIPRYEFQTKTCKKTQNPLFCETFRADLTWSELKQYTLKLSVFDEERFANDTNLGEVLIPLKELNITENGEETLHTFDLKEMKQDNGEILFGLSYLPTAERLTFHIVKANNLHSVTEEVEHFVPYVRILLIHNGKLWKKKKTSTRPGTKSPCFNESLTFDVPSTEMENVVFIVVVSHRDPHNSAMSSPETPTTPPGSVKRDHHVGKILIGSCASGSAEHHWKAMKQSPRKQVTQWHTLR
ncbi:synaptotagmin-7-like isoform X2 [Tachypleus tridentatus]|uniref:synaptotagmin-7-like isoform X2 n=1 Tax=Tachypleus tridentatus TaxID=6853 RepID=UPI003FD4FFD8